MVYKKFQDLKLSALGLGAMRLPVIKGDDAKINSNATAEMVAYAMENGVNYYDTAWGYHSGQSEIIMGEVLTKYPRESYYLADKFPGYELSNMDKIETIFEKQLKKCKVDYFDFYLFHNVCEINIDAYLNEKYGIFNYLMEQKKAGRIRHLGFSIHGSLEVLKRFLEAYGDSMEFCQIQLNYMDWSFQKAKEKIDLLATYRIPLWVMEPLRGGRLATLPDNHTAALKAMRPLEDTPAWAFRFLQTIPNVTMVLSGMSNLQQLKDNIHTFDEEKPLTPTELEAILKIADELIKHSSVPCTACHYCVSHCPKNLDIPLLLSLYNEHRSTKEGFGFIAPMALMALPEDKQPQACIACKSCEAVCPQQIEIANALADFSQRINR